MAGAAVEPSEESDNAPRLAGVPMPRDALEQALERREAGGDNSRSCERPSIPAQCAATAAATPAARAPATAPAPLSRREFTLTISPTTSRLRARKSVPSVYSW